MKDIKFLNISIYFLILLYAVGAFAMLFTAYSNLFLSLTPLNLLLTFLMLLYFQVSKNRKFYLFVIVSFLIGFIMEVIGVNTGFPFGSYEYGKHLGFKIFETPLSIGLNWVLLSLCIGNFCNTLVDNYFVKIWLASSLMVLLDFLIEPVAIHFNWWNWENSTPGIFNYLGWFAISFLIFSIYFKLSFTKNNPMATPVFFILIAFFWLIGLFV